MTRTRFRPALRKKFIARFGDYDVYSINAFAIRNLAEPDEEFTNFATHEEFTNLIPKNEIWVAETSIKKEGIFFIADSLMRGREKAKRRSTDDAYEAGIQIERFLREKLNGIKYRGRGLGKVPKEVYVEKYFTIPDSKFPVQVFRVEGNVVRSLYKTDYTEGGHGYVYPWVPRHEIWVEIDLDAAEVPFIVSHEYLELRLMRDEKLEYDKAHEVCAHVEFELRRNQGIRCFLSSRGKSLQKADLVNLPSTDLFQYILKNYLRK